MDVENDAVYKLLKRMASDTELVRLGIAFQAKQLVLEFIAERTHRQKHEMDLVDQTAGYKQKIAATYAPLCLTARVQHGCLEITWFLTSHSRKNANQPHVKSRSHYKNLPTSRGRGPITYTTRTLKRYARPWEEDLVLATEVRAAALRKLNAQTTKARLVVATMIRQIESTAIFDSIADFTPGTQTKHVEPSIYDNPDVAPQPPQHRQRSE